MLGVIFDVFRKDEGLLALKVDVGHGIASTTDISVRDNDPLNELLSRTLTADDLAVEVFRSVKALRLKCRLIVVTLMVKGEVIKIIADLRHGGLGTMSRRILGQELTRRMTEVLKSKKHFISLDKEERSVRVCQLSNPNGPVTYRDKTKVKDSAMVLTSEGSIKVKEDCGLVGLLTVATKHGPVTQGVYCLVKHLRYTKLRWKAARVGGGLLTINLTEGTCNFTGPPLPQSVVEYVRSVSKNPYPK